MDKASAYGVGDCRFESYRGHLSLRCGWWPCAADPGTCQQQPGKMAFLVPVARDVAVGTPSGAPALEAERLHGICARAPCLSQVWQRRAWPRTAVPEPAWRPSSDARLTAQLSTSCVLALPVSDKEFIVVVRWRGDINFPEFA